MKGEVILRKTGVICKVVIRKVGIIRRYYKEGII